MDQQMRYTQDVIEKQREIDATRLNLYRQAGIGKNIDTGLEALHDQEKLLALKKNQLGVEFELERRQERINEVTQKYGFFFDAIGQGMTNTFDLLIKGTNDWGNSLRNIAATVLQDIAKQLLKIYVIDQSISFLKSAIGGIGAGPSGGSNVLGNFNMAAAAYGSANGNVFAANGIVPYAMGGIVDRPTIFPFAKGVGLMGEAGPEAIIPLKRGSDGKLGVSGGSGTSVVVNVDAKGTSVQGDNTQSAALGRAISSAVQAELIKQRRPGGLLAAA
jgi:phage-related minor tail protein